MDSMWLKALLSIDANGVTLNSRNGNSSEIIGYSTRLENVKKNFLFNKIRNLDPRYACAELLWYLTMTDDTSFLQLFAPGYKRFTEDGIHAFGAYGKRWITNSGSIGNNQITDVIETLKRHPETRQAIVTMWHGTDLEHAKVLDKKDLPCTLTHQFLLRDGYLNMVTNMRSNDAWLGMPYDVYCNTQLLKLIASSLEVQPGSYTHNVGSMHFYEHNFEKINSILEMQESDLTISAPGSNSLGAVTSYNLRLQANMAVNFVKWSFRDMGATDPEIGIKTNFKESGVFHSIITDAALVCASKVNSGYVKYILDKQLLAALEVFNV